MSKSSDTVRNGLLAVLVIVLLLIGVGLATGVVPSKLQTSVVGAPICQGADSSGLQFDAKTRDVLFAAVTESNEGRGVVYRSRATALSDYDVVGRLLPGNCQVGFDGFCIGQPQPDLTGGDLRDQQWFILPDGAGYVSGAVVQEMPPGTIGQAPQTCRGGREEPREISVVGTPSLDASGNLTVELDSPAASGVGVAVFVTDGQGSGDWKQVGVDGVSSDGFLVTGTSPIDLTTAATITFAACWAGNVPGRAQGHAVVTPPGASAEPAAPTEADLRRGASIACSQVGGGS